MSSNHSLHRTLNGAGELGRVCQAWHGTSEVQILVPGMRGAEGEEKGQGAHREVGSGGSPIPTRGATHRNRRGGGGTTRDARARDGEVLQPHGVGWIHPASRRGTGCVVPWEICRVSSGTEGGEIRPDRPAAGSRGPTRRRDTATRRNPPGRTRNPPCRSQEQGTDTLGLDGLRVVGCPPLPARTGPREGREGEEESRRVEWGQGIREAAGAAPGRARGGSYRGDTGSGRAGGRDSPVGAGVRAG